MGKILDTQSYENLFRFNLEMNEKLLAPSDFCNEITHLIAEYCSYLTINSSIYTTMSTSKKYTLRSI